MPSTALLGLWSCLILGTSFPDPALRTFQDGFTGRRVVRFSSDGRYLAWNGGTVKGAPAVYLWDCHKETTLTLGRLETDQTRILALAFDGPRLVAVVTDKLVVWDIASGKLLHETPMPIMHGRGLPVLSANGAAVALADAQGKVQYAFVNDLKNFISLKEKCRSRAVLQLAADGTRLVVVDAGQVRLYDTVKKELLKTLDVPDSLRCIALSKDYSYLAYGGVNRFGLIDLTTGKLESYSLSKEPGAGMSVHAITMSPDRQSLLLGGFKLIRFDIPRKKIVTIRPLAIYGISHEVQAMDVAQDGKLFASGHTGRVQLWDYRELFK